MKLVTGAGGFIGSNLVAALEAAGDEIAACDCLDSPAKMRNLENKRIAERISPHDLLDFMQNQGTILSSYIGERQLMIRIFPPIS